ncbi:hypothetical protein scyTo_0017535, partial [Scyliorhinus torazame]|nr:hypothetical protein [Scyliorhinus torazame]
FRLVILYLLLINGDRGSAIPHDRIYYSELQQLSEDSTGESYESLHSQYMPDSVIVNHLYQQEPLVFDESPQFETLTIQKSLTGNRDAILDLTSLTSDPVPQNPIGIADSEYNEIGHSDTCKSNGCALNATPNSTFAKNLNPSTQNKRDANLNPRSPTQTNISPLPTFNELTEGSGDVHGLVPDPDSTELQSRRIDRKEFDGVTERSNDLVPPTSKNNKPEYSLTTLHTSNTQPDQGSTPTESKNDLQGPMTPTDGLLLNRRKEVDSKTIPGRPPNADQNPSMNHWPIKPELVAEPNTDQASNDSWSVCKPGYIHENNSCWSLCKVIPDYCFNGGECGVVENIGVFCRCSEKDYAWYKGLRCQSVLTKTQLICILFGACLLIILLFLTLTVTFVFKLRSLKKDQQMFDSRRLVINFAVS